MARDLPREQDQSIKDRKRLLYEDDDPPAAPASKPFDVYLRETPAAPLSPTIKAALWGAGIVVGLLLAAAVLRSARGTPPAKPRAEIRRGNPEFSGPARLVARQRRFPGLHAFGSRVGVGGPV